MPKPPEQFREEIIQIKEAAEASNDVKLVHLYNLILHILNVIIRNTPERAMPSWDIQALSELHFIKQDHGKNVLLKIEAGDNFIYFELTKLDAEFMMKLYKNDFVVTFDQVIEAYKAGADFPNIAERNNTAIKAFKRFTSNMQIKFNKNGIPLMIDYEKTPKGLFRSGFIRLEINQSS